MKSWTGGWTQILPRGVLTFWNFQRPRKMFPTMSFFFVGPRVLRGLASILSLCPPLTDTFIYTFHSARSPNTSCPGNLFDFVGHLWALKVVSFETLLICRVSYVKLRFDRRDFYVLSTLIGLTVMFAFKYYVKNCIFKWFFSCIIFETAFHENMVSLATNLISFQLEEMCIIEHFIFIGASLLRRIDSQLVERNIVSCS